MRRIYIILTAAILLYACEENFSPKTDYAKDYALYSVINYDTTSHAAYLSSSYMVEGYDPYANTVDPAVKDAVIKYTINNTKVYTFTQMETARADTSRYKTPFIYYKLNNCKINDGDAVELSVTIGGKTLKSKINVPPLTYLQFSGTTSTFDPSNGDMPGVVYSWKYFFTNSSSLQTYFSPKLEIVYHKADNPGKQLRTAVPIYFVKENETYKPVYPSISANTTVTFYKDAIIKSLEMISYGDANKANYVIDKAEFTLLCVDKNLASYIGAENTFKGEFSVRIDATDFTNIENGFGLFGIYTNKKAKVEIVASLPHSMGYKTSYD